MAGGWFWVEWFESAHRDGAPYQGAGGQGCLILDFKFLIIAVGSLGSGGISEAASMELTKE